jgi:uncharacterized oxidoreductase
MKTKDNTILITGGATGIGLALAEILLNSGNKVIICGRRENKLKEARDKLPEIQTRVCDVSREKDRESLFNWVKKEVPDINVLINNAGVQRFIDFRKGTAELFNRGDEIETDLVSPINLCAYFIPLLSEKSEAAIMNVSSGLAFVPIASMPVYCAAKAALHSFTVSLRHQLKDTPIKVFEIVPPVVDTDLSKGNPDEPDDHRGIPPSAVAKAVLAAMANNEYEIVVAEAKNLVAGSRTNPEQAFRNINRW